MKKTALLIDDGRFGKGLGKISGLPGGRLAVAQLIKNASPVLGADEELFRISYY